MYIVPNSLIYIYENMPIDSNYKHTFYFANKTEQYAYFKNNKIKYTLDKCSYQRFNSGIRVNLNVNNLTNCNYLSFVNSSYSSKMFFCFITNIEYVNDTTSYIEFEIDVVQTFIHDVNFNQCFIERNHTRTDNIGDNIVPENVELGEYVFNNYDIVYNLRDLAVVVAVAEPGGNLYDGIFGGCTLYVYESTDVQGINSLINNYIEKPSQIISMYMIPLELIGSIPTSHKVTYGAGANSFDVTLSALSGSESLNGYTPINKKLYTYPYNFLSVDNASGSNLSLRYEFFENRTPVLEINGTITQPVIVNLRPANYKGLSQRIGVNQTLNTENLQLNGYPMCSWSVDTYKMWVAQNAVPFAINSISSATQAIASGGITAGGTISSVSNLLTQRYIASNQADIVKGTFNNGNINCATRKQNFYHGRCSINSNYAKVIDDYFTKYGYAIKQIGTPAIHNRSRYTYIKTQECNFTGGTIASQLKKLNDIFDAGITFWSDKNNVGNYALPNNLL